MVLKNFITICDKRDDFNFKIMNYPNLSGNVPKKPCYGVFISQPVRYDNINLHIDPSLDVMVIVTQNYHRKKLGEIFIHFVEKCIHIYGLNYSMIYLIETLLNTCFSVFTTDCVLT